MKSDLDVKHFKSYYGNIRQIDNDLNKNAEILSPFAEVGPNVK